MSHENLWGTHRGAVSLTFDDGRSSQLERAIPALDERSLRATFYLCPATDRWMQRLAPWREVAEAGHEIGNHTVSHFCSGNFWGEPGGLEDKTLDDIEHDILTAHERLLQIAPHQQAWTFAYPCYCTFVGRGASRQSYVPLVARHFVAGRSGGEYGFANHPAVIDLACVWGSPVERMSGFEMIGLVEDLTFRGQWVVLVFHEVDGPRLSVSREDFHLLLDFLKRTEDQIWTAPVVEVAGKIAAFQSGS